MRSPVRLQSRSQRWKSNAPCRILSRDRCGMRMSTTKPPSSNSMHRRVFWSLPRRRMTPRWMPTRYGVRSLVDVVQAERQLAQARLAVVRSQAQLMQSAVGLSYATGDLLQHNASS